jgi:hypothetical protein
MNEHPYILFNKSLEQLRLLGARGGRTYSRNQRVRRRALLPMPRPALPARGTLSTTTAESIVELDTRFPWLRGVEKRLVGSRHPRPRRITRRQQRY